MIPISALHRPTLALALGTALLAGCSITTAEESPSESDSAAVVEPTVEQSTEPVTGPVTEQATSEPSSEDGRPTVAGYGVGEFPPVPLFTLPDLALLDAALSGFTPELTELVGDYPGLTISPARCDERGELDSGVGSLLLYGDGSGRYTGPDGSVRNYGDGTGQYEIGGVRVRVYSGGSGHYRGNGLDIRSYGDGTGYYEDDDADLRIRIYSGGSGYRTLGEETIRNYGDGSGYHETPAFTIRNYGDGSGYYESPELTIRNWGDGTGEVDGAAVEMAPLDPVPPLGSFPAMGAIEPITACGTTITLDSAVLFDIDRWDIRPEADAVLDSLAAALSDGAVPTAQVAGHTDSIRDAAWNQQLSENRADAVVEALIGRGVSSTLEAVGFGETRPVATNDDPAGRQLNRRVEIFIPTF